MKSIDKLCAAGRNMAKGRNLENHEECNLLLVIADEIEAEIAANYLESPKDVDGVSIHVGNICEIDGYKFVVRQLTTDGSCWWAVDKFGEFYIAQLCRYVKPRTLEDVLTEMLDRNTDGVGLREFNRDFGAFVAHYADEIRELFGGDAE